MTLVSVRPNHAGLLSSLLESPLQFDSPVSRSATQLTRGTREVVVTPKSPPKVSQPALPPQPSSSRSVLASPPSRKGKEPVRSSDLAWPENLARLKRSGAGLNNPSMACYANATLQILLHTPPVLSRLLEHSSETCVQNSKAFCMTCALSSLAKKHWNHKHYSPNEVHNNLPRIRKGFSKHRQEDTHEFFRFVTDGLQATELAEFPKNVPDKIKQDTWVHLTWGGRVRSRVVCSKCRKPSDTFDTFLDLSLDVNRGGRAMLLSMLQGFIREDRLEGENKYHCDNCKGKANATKSFRIARVPPVLTFHLKRFSVNYDHGRARAQKYNQMIEYPEFLDMAPYMIDGVQGSKYRLTGVTCHRGAELRFGHYTSYVRGPDDRWYHADDDEMTLVSTTTALNERTAYVLSYIRIGDGEFPEALASAGSKRKLEQTTTDSPVKRRETAPQTSDRADSPSPPPILPTGSPVQRSFGYQPRYTPPTIRSESFYGSQGKKAKRKMKGPPMLFDRGQRKGMIRKMRRK